MNSIDDVKKPVAWMNSEEEYVKDAFAWHKGLKDFTTPLYTHPPANDVAELVEVLRLVKKGMENGYIKSAPYMDFDPNAENLEMKHPLQAINAALKKWELK